jgi:hypothetical protein
MQARVTAETLKRSLAAVAEDHRPFRHWRPRGMLDGGVALALSELPLRIPDGLDLSAGRRETNNASRMFFDQAGQAAHPAMRSLAEAMQSPDVVAAWERLCGLDLDGTFLRIEYCRDGDGFWLEPHTDIGAKRITILLYLSTDDGGETWGTDVYDEQRRFVASIPGDFNCGLVFIPSPNSFHGFEKRPITGLRRSLMLNYVGPEWRSRHELCFPDQPVATKGS